MKKILKNKLFWIIVASLVLVTIIVALAILDANNIPSSNGMGYIHFDWIEISLTLVVGILTLYLTATIANQQKKIESDKIASEKFFRIEFIEKYQRIIADNESSTLKLKIKELDKDALKFLEITNDLTITPIENHKPNYSKNFIAKARRAECEFEYTSKGMDKDWLENPNKEAFCFARIPLQNIDISKFEKGKVYRMEMNIVVTDIFNVEVKCRLYPWLKVEQIKTEKDKTTVSFSIKHNFGYYDSVKYIGEITTRKEK